MKPIQTSQSGLGGFRDATTDEAAQQSDRLLWVCHRTLCSHLGHTAEICQKVNLELLSGCWSRYGQKATAPAVWLAERLINSLQLLWRSIFAVDLLLSLKQVTFQSFFLFFFFTGWWMCSADKPMYRRSSTNLYFWLQASNSPLRSDSV